MSHPLFTESVVFPRLAVWLLERYTPPHLLEGITGDLEEQFAEERAEQRRGVAQFLFWKELLLVCLWHRGRRKAAYHQANVFDMWQNYFKIAVRTMRRQPGFSTINVLGLSVGMACCMLLLLYIQHERSYDQHHAHADRIYRVVDGDWAATPPPLGPALHADYPNYVEQAVRLMPQRSPVPVGYRDQVFTEPNITFADSNYFAVFSQSLLRGDPATALLRPYTVAISEQVARKYFGNEDPIGQSLMFYFRAEEGWDFEVTGVFADQPDTEHYPFDILIPFSTMAEWLGQWAENWNWAALYNYVLLTEGTNPARLETALPDFFGRNAGQPERAMQLQPLRDIHLDAAKEKDFGPRTNVAYVILLGIIAGFVLLVACVNFMNLTTARATERAKEVGMRKTLGAPRRQLMGQFLGESVLLSLGSLVLALGLVWLAQPLFAELAGKQLVLTRAHLGMLVAFLALALGVGVLGGLYPAVVLSRFVPADVLRNAQAGRAAGARLRQGLVVGQFAIATFLMVGAAVVFQQLNYMQHSDLGFDEEQVLVMRTGNYPVMKEKLQAVPGVVSVSSSSELPGERHGMYPIRMEGMPADSSVNLRSTSVSFDYFETMGMTLAAGRAFDRAITTDMGGAAILNEAAVEMLRETYGLTGRFVGKTADWLWGDPQTFTVVGVVADYHYASLHSAVEPLIITMRPAHSRMQVRVAAEDFDRTVAQIEAIWAEVEPVSPFAFTLLDTQLDALYRAERRLGNVFTVFTLLTIFIACLGLFGLAAFTASKRRHEIGVRKVMGASVGTILLLLTKDFARLVIIAIAVALPLAYFAAQEWLGAFAYRIDLGAGVFVGAALLALGIAVLTISYQAVKAARLNPVEALRHD